MKVLPPEATAGLALHFKIADPAGLLVMALVEGVTDAHIY